MKKLKYLLLAVALFISTSAFAAGSVNVIGYTPFAYEKIAVSNLAVSRLNATYRETAGAVFITIESNNIRYRIEGGDPDADDGHLVISASYQNLWFNDPASIREFRTIAIGGNATLIVTYYRRN